MVSEPRNWQLGSQPAIDPTLFDSLFNVFMTPTSRETIAHDLYWSHEYPEILAYQNIIRDEIYKLLNSN